MRRQVMVVCETMRLPLGGFGCGGLIVTSRIDQDDVRAICQFEIFQDPLDLCELGCSEINDCLNASPGVTSLLIDLDLLF